MENSNSEAVTTNSALIEFLFVLGKLKRTKRTGWINNKIENPESIADHMYRMAIMSFFLPSATINREHCIKMSLVHDMAESIVGDITPYDGVSDEEKFKREEVVYEVERCLSFFHGLNGISSHRILLLIGGDEID